MLIDEFHITPESSPYAAAACRFLLSRLSFRYDVYGFIDIDDRGEYEAFAAFSA